VRIRKLINKNYILLIFLVFIVACSSNGSGSVDIDLPDGVHLEDTVPGSFLKALQIDYEGDLSFLGEIRKSLRKIAILEDEYTEGESKLDVKRWRIVDSRNKNSFILYEKMGSDGYLWYEYPMGVAGGVPYSSLIGGKAKNLKPNRKYGGSVYIKSKTDDAKLVLFGFGNYCEYIGVMYWNWIRD